MYIFRLVAEYYDKINRTNPSVFAPSVELENPKWEEIEYHLRRLDGNNTTVVRLIHSDEDEMSIGGGQDGMYVCTRYCSHGDSYLVNSSSTSTVSHRLVVGQVGEYPDRYIVPLDLVMKAAKTYFKNGILDDTLDWE